MAYPQQHYPNTNAELYNPYPNDDGLGGGYNSGYNFPSNRPYEDEGPYRDLSQGQQPYQEPNQVPYQDLHQGQNSHNRTVSETSGFYPEETDAPHSKEKIEGQTFNAYRYESRRKLWNKGGGLRCCGRFCCCTIMIALFLAISIILSLVLWVEPPNVIIGNFVPMSIGGSIFQVNTSAIDVNLGINISVSNPNYFSVDLKSVNVALFYPINNTAVGGGQKNNINIRSHAQTNFTFPFTLQYTMASDPSHTVLTDLANKCTNNQAISVNYKVTLGIRLIFVTISPVISNSASFACPLSATDIAGLLTGAGINLTGRDAL